MIKDLLQIKWNKLKDQIEVIKNQSTLSDEDIRKIRKLKNEASVLKFALERIRMGCCQEEVISSMIEDRKVYSKLYGGADGDTL